MNNALKVHFKLVIRLMNIPQGIWVMTSVDGLKGDMSVYIMRDKECLRYLLEYVMCITRINPHKMYYFSCGLLEIT